MAKPVPSNEPNSARPGTLIESEEDIRRAMLANKAAIPVATPVAMQNAAGQASAKLPEVTPFRPTIRPPICLLTILDDGKSEGEVIRIRSNRFVIGRTEGDLLLPHDEQISSRHIEITRQQMGGQQRWVVTDLQSTNGLFLRVSRTVLLDKAEFLVGKGRYRYEEPGDRPPETVDNLDPAPIPSGTVGYAEGAPGVVHPALAELVAGGIGNRILLAKNEYWIGTDPSCAICRTGDAFTSPRHVRLYREPKGAWHAQNNKTLNGLWLKIPQVTVEDGCLLQIGEQRLRLKVGG
jgi:pSer/pThr/pTyr-binding forkhead associated (FHA) protein